MTEFQIRTQIDSLEIKLRKVAMRFFEMKSQLEQALKENEDLRKLVIETQKENQELQKKLNEQEKNFKKSDNFTKIVSDNLKNTGNTAELKERLDEYIAEIEKCISQLSN
ncbi:MAG: hypothetical protein ACOVOW_01855 [Spirosomataceae bacterium]|jgi:predicted nuclease with TOPRIM domain|nr:hypothetical protein [Flectobacillus sp.]